ncbi:flagellar protein FlhE [Halomonas marinisediminis]|uniref:Flagellar protein FlhE n=1 Tax=Halomonas marinisediminis TaxID=2546095 RepID=A0ABY2D5J8_9GAMM|nr:flagellar protein FlhE [Halomonas marinisediminis]TDB01968.1 flagellar protein FlhE [Halomonas marinisediminis]
MKLRTMVALVGMLVVADAHASGSWSQQAPGPRLVIPGRTVETPLAPPGAASLSGRQVTRVRWRFDHDAAPGGFAASLCHQEACVEVVHPFGWTDALYGKPADGDLRFRFRRLSPQGPPIQIRHLRIIVDYR